MMSSVDPFDPVSVAVCARSPRSIDDRGRTHFVLPAAGTLRFTSTSDGAQCALTAVAGQAPGHQRAAPSGGQRVRELVYRSFELSNEGARRLATAMRLLASYREHPWRNRRRLRTIEAIVVNASFDLPDAPEWLAAPFADVKVDDEEAVRRLVSNPFHPLALKRQAYLGDVRDVKVRGRRSDENVTGVRYPHRLSISIATRAQAEHVSGVIVREDATSVHPRDFELPVPGALLLLAVCEAIEYVKRTGPRTSGALRMDPFGRRAMLNALLEEAVAGLVDPVEGYGRVIALFEPSMWPRRAADLPPRQLSAIALMAMRCSTARGGSLMPGPAVDLARVKMASGRQPTPVGDELALRFGSAELVVRVDEDLAMGRGTVLGPDGRVVSGPCVLSASGLEWAAWAAAALDTPEASGSSALEEFLADLIADPWFDLGARVAPVRDELERMARRLGRGRRTSAFGLGDVLARTPDRLGT